MKSVKRYSTFEEIKCSDKKPVDDKTRLKRHTDFEKFITAIIPAKYSKKAGHQSK